jgi:hypothetical protein
MSNQLWAGSLASFSGSMADEMDKAMAALSGGSLPADDDRRKLFIAIATGVVNHLKANPGAFQITVNAVPATVSPTIGVRSS